jgi:Virulence factor membrane-bound polymerase, C-terminal/Protein glycosylation ligase/O-Antigen ligase
MPFLRIPVFFVLLAIPWLNPFAPGPSAAMVPWLVSLACVGAALWLVPSNIRWGTLPGNVAMFFAANALYFALHMLWMGVSAEGWATLLAWACLVAMVSVGATLRQADAAHPPYASYLACMWLAVALLSVGMALCQYLQIEQWFAPWISHSGDGVPFANLRQRNQFATLCGVGLLALLYLRQTSLQAANTFLQTLWPWLAAGVLAFGNGLSSSRTGGLQWLLVAVVIFCWRSSLHRGVRRLGYGAVGMYAVTVVLMPWFADAVGNASSGLWGRAQEGVTGGSRLWLYSNVLELIAQKPWLGWGWRELAYAHYSTSFGTRFVELLDNAHNLPLHLAVELGAPYALLFCAAVLAWVLRAAPWRERDAMRQLAWGVLLLLGVHSMVEYPLWYGPFLMTLGLCIGLLQPAFLQSKPPSAQQSIARAAIKYIALIFMLMAGYAAYDYHRVSQIYLDTESRSGLYEGDALAHAQRSLIYRRQARFAELVTTPITPATAPRVLSLAADLVHYSPEPRVIEALIESATMLHFDDVAMFHLAHYKEAYPKDYAAWSALK